MAQQRLDKKINFALWGFPVMILLLVVVTIQGARVRNAQVENSDIARQQRELSIKLTNMAIKKMDTVISGQDSIFLLFKAKTVRK